jgi:alkyldihydroxyacetonephosphate synthase
MSERKRSHWGWGWADKFPPAEQRKQLGKQLGMMLGIEPTGPAEPVALEDVALHDARVGAPEKLSFVTSDREERIRHTYGRAFTDVVRGFAGDFSPAPDLVAHPTTEEEVGHVLDWAQGAKVAVVPYGGGTSVVRGVECPLPEGFAGTLSLDLRGLEKVLEVEQTSRTARIQAGATGPRLEEQLAEHGMTLRCFPQSFEHSTLGGWIATRAGGHFATNYTHIDDLTAAVRALTPAGVKEGSVWASRRLPGSGAGPSPDRMMLGSEGTLGVITEAWVRVRPRPQFRASASVRFQEYEDAVAACRAVSQSGLFPSNCRLLDSREAKLNMVATDGSAVLLLGFESADHPLEPWMARALELAKDFGGEPSEPKYSDSGKKTGDSGQAGSWKNAFIEMPYLQNVLLSLGVIADTFETAIPWDRFDGLHAAIVKNVRGAMKEVCGSPCHLSCRFTHVYPDGPAPYYTFIAKARPGAELEQWAAIKKAASDTLIEHGATITHHHAVGRTHAPWYRKQRPPGFGDALRALKGALDPEGILNPGALI